MRIQKRKNKQKLLREFSTVEVGDRCRLGQCCREVKLGAIPKIGLVLSGFNTLSNQYEEFVVEIVATDPWKSIVRRIK